MKMKKLVLLLGLFAVIAGSVAAYFAYNKPKIILPKPIEQGFKNPLFYRPMYGYSRLWYSFICDTVITPYSITDFQEGTNDDGEHYSLAETFLCDLIENENDHVKYDCYSCHIMFYADHSCHHEIISYHMEEYDEKEQWYWVKEQVKNFDRQEEDTGYSYKVIPYL